MDFGLIKESIAFAEKLISVLIYARRTDAHALRYDRLIFDGWCWSHGHWACLPFFSCIRSTSIVPNVAIKCVSGVKSQYPSSYSFTFRYSVCRLIVLRRIDETEFLVLQSSRPNGVKRIVNRWFCSSLMYCFRWWFKLFGAFLRFSFVSIFRDNRRRFVCKAYLYCVQNQQLYTTAAVVATTAKRAYLYFI